MKANCGVTMKCPADRLSTVLGVDGGLPKEGNLPCGWEAPTNRLAVYMEQKGKEG